MNSLLSKSSLAILSLALCAGLCRGDEWKELKSQEGNFRVQLPGESMYLPQDVKLDDGTTLKLHVFAAETDAGAISYMAFYNDYSADHVRNTGADTILRNCQKGALENANAKLDKDSEIALGKHPGREFRFTGESDGDKFQGVWRIYLVKNRLYQLGAIGVEKKIPADSLAKFQKSFELLRDAE